MWNNDDMKVFSEKVNELVNNSEKRKLLGNNAVNWLFYYILFIYILYLLH